MAPTPTRDAGTPVDGDFVLDAEDRLSRWWDGRPSTRYLFELAPRPGVPFELAVARVALTYAGGAGTRAWRQHADGTFTLLQEAAR